MKISFTSNIIIFKSDYLKYIPKFSGIYMIKNLYNGKFYIGSSKNCYSRLKSHLCFLKKNKHHNLYLQRSWNKNSYFGIIILWTTNKKEDISILKHLEQLFIDRLNPPYNLSKTANRISHDDDFKIRLSNRMSKEYVVKYNNEQEKTIRNLTKFCRENGLNRNCMLSVLNKNGNHHKGWRIKRIGENWKNPHFFRTNKTEKNLFKNSPHRRYDKYR